MLYKIAAYFLKNQERKEVLLIASIVIGLGTFLLCGNFLNQAIPENLGIASMELRKIVIFGISFAVALATTVSGILKVSRLFDKIQTNYIIR